MAAVVTQSRRVYWLSITSVSMIYTVMYAWLMQTDVTCVGVSDGGHRTSVSMEQCPVHMSSVARVQGDRLYVADSSGWCCHEQPSPVDESDRAMPMTITQSTEYLNGHVVTAHGVHRLQVLRP